MKWHLVVALTLSVFGTQSVVAKGAAIKGEWQPEKVADNTYVIHGPLGMPSPENQGFMNNPAFIIGTEGVVVVDPGASVQVGEMLLARIEKMTDKPIVAVFNSHIHGDHWLANQAIKEKYPDVPIYGRENTGPRIIGGEGARWVQLMLNMTQKATAGTKVVGPDHPVDNGDVIKAAGLTFEIIGNEKAHTDTDIMVLAKERDVIFLGDNAGYGRILRLEGGSYRGNVEALNLAVATGAKVFVPGHGKTGGTEAATAYRDFLATVYETAKQGYDDGKADFEIRPMLMPKMAAWEQWTDFENLLGQHINAAFLEAEAADFE